MSRHPLRLLVALLTAVPLLAACGSHEGSADRTITVLAASSLTETFTELKGSFEAHHPGVTVDLVFDSSATLAQHAVDGAPGDVLATADPATMQAARDGGALAGASTDFATNTMVVVTPADNPAGITRFADLNDARVRYVVCVDTAPCGKVAATLLGAGQVTRDPASLEPDVKAVLAKVTAGEADAGLVYATDAAAARDLVTEVDIPGADSAVTTYPIAALTQSRQPELAQEFVDLVTGPEGQQVLADAGFGAA